ncbi:MAG: hypothetical protein E6G27_17780, partial [Actinobacteria bacterium]
MGPVPGRPGPHGLRPRPRGPARSRLPVSRRGGGGVRLTRLHLRNYRVYEDALDLEIPPGLVGIYGVNGAGKSALLESVLFALWGR